MILPSLKKPKWPTNPRIVTITSTNLENRIIGALGYSFDSLYKDEFFSIAMSCCVAI